MLSLLVEVVAALGGGHDVSSAAIKGRLVKAGETIAIPSSKSHVVNVAVKPEAAAVVAPRLSGRKWEMPVKQEVIAGYEEAGSSDFGFAFWTRELGWQKVSVLTDARVKPRMRDSSWGAPEVLDPDLDEELPFVVRLPLNAWVENRQRDIGAFSRDQRRSIGVRGGDRTTGFPDASVREPNRTKETERTQCGESQCPDCVFQ